MDLLPDEQVTGTVKRQAALLLWRLGRDNRILALVTASQIASASTAYLWLLRALSVPGA